MYQHPALLEALAEQLLHDRVTGARTAAVGRSAAAVRPWRSAPRKGRRSVPQADPVDRRRIGLHAPLTDGR
jgi:hypothetical protein